MGQPTLSLKTIAERISDAILSEKYVNKAVIIEKITINLRVWHKLTNRPIDYDSIKTDKGKLQYTIEKKDVELEFWRSKLKDKIGKDNMQPFYDELESKISEMGY